ncbi:MAG: RNA polymerase sigma-54 factor [Flavobacteriales bacterium]|jgi:RNA polymerase sigma-54 factor
MQRLSLSQKLQQKLSPQQIKLMKLIQLPTIALEARIKEEMEDNPALDEGLEELEDDFDNNTDTEEREIIETDINVDEYLSDDEVPSYKLSANNYSADDEEKTTPIAVGTSFTDLLYKQLNMHMLGEEKSQLAIYLVGNIDDDGYLRRDISSIVDDLAFSQGIISTEADLLEALKVIQKLDPVGVGARDLKECLLLQLERKDGNRATRLAIRILNEGFDPFIKKHYSKLLQQFDIDEERLKEAIHEISRLNPKPGNSLSETTKVTQHITPDFTLRIEEGELQLTLNSRNAPELKVSRTYSGMLETYRDSKEKSKSQKEAVQFVKQKLDAAKWFIDAIKQRQHTLIITMQAILDYQKEYFLSGDERKMRPMILKDIADIVKMDISTISRVANSKYVETPYGTFLIKTFFSESMTNDQGEEVSTKEIKKILEDVVGIEDKRKPLTDDRLAAILKEKGYPIARRTIAKYREQLNIPVARLRKEL